MTKYGRNTYEYDGNNYRVFKQTPSEKTYYNYDGSGNLRFERRGRTEINYVYDSNGIQGMRVTVPTKDAATSMQVKNITTSRIVWEIFA